MAQAAFKTERILSFCETQLAEWKKEAIEDREKAIKKIMEWEKKRKHTWWRFWMTVHERSYFDDDWGSWRCWVPCDYRKVSEIYHLCGQCDSECVYLNTEDANMLVRNGLKPGEEVIEANPPPEE